MASIDSMIGAGAPRTWDGDAITPWSSTTCAPQTLDKTLRCFIAKTSAKPHVQSRHALGQKGVVDCSQGLPPTGAPSGDRLTAPDDEGPVCAGIVRDPFPATTVYAVATFVDPAAKHWDRKKRAYVVGPVTTKVFYQFAGIRHLDQAAPMIRPMG